ncbi:MAG: tyrosine-type recombinase/integrase [Deltaproteobacteria bacterium]|nr:tyrosine-type recombinase/integrase [Deltaproteobacteria bacterium]
MVGDLFLDARNGNVLVRNGKGNKARIVAISDRLASYLAEYVTWKSAVGEPVEAESPVFRSERKEAMTRSAVHRVWKAALSRAELPTRWGVHSTRHSYAVEVYRKTKDLRLTQRLLGHASPVTTQVYANLLDSDVRRGVEAVWAA